MLFGKRKIWNGLAAVLAACLFTSVSAAAQGGDLVDMVQDTGSEASVKSYLTGEDISEEIGRRRPIAVMLGNSSDGCPQSGISNAGVIYEAPVEGDITRLMAVFEDYGSLEKIGSVRSCRDYYLFYANEFDAIYCHYGQAVYALQYFDQNLIDHLDGITMEGTAYYRSSDRKAPHNAYTGYSWIQKGIEQKGFSQEYREGYTGHYRFAPEGTETVLAEGAAANIVRLDNFTVNHPWFEYDPETKEYKRFQYGEAQIDEANSQQLTCDNIILQYSSYQPYDENGYLNIDTSSGGKGKYITRGKAIDITWEKDTQWGITRYYDQNHNEIQLNTGKTWVEIIKNDRIDSVTYQ